LAPTEPAATGSSGQPLTVWIVNHYAILPDLPGGTRHYSLATRLARRGHRVTVFASGFHHLLRHETRLGPGELVRRDEVDGVQFLWLRTRPHRRNDWRRALNMAEFAWRLLARATRGEPPPDVVVGSSPHPLAAVAAERLAARHGVPFVLEIRDLWPQTFVDLGRLSPCHPLVLALYALERYLYRRAARIVTVWSDAWHYMEAHGVDPGRVTWIPNGVDFGLVPPPRPLPVSPALTVMFAGLHCDTVGLEHVLGAAEILRERGWGDRILFRLVGDGPEKPALRREAERRGLDTVRFEDSVPKHAVYDTLAQAHVLLAPHRNIPLYRWGIGDNKLYDALAVGRPVVLTGDPPQNPVREAGAGLVVEGGNPRALADALETLARVDRETLAAMGRRGREYAEHRHDFDRLAALLENVLRSAVAGAGAAPRTVSRQAQPPRQAKKNTNRLS